MSDEHLEWEKTYRDSAPDCCQNCYQLADDFDEARDETVYYCRWNTTLPTTKQTCKRHKPIEEAAA